MSVVHRIPDEGPLPALVAALDASARVERTPCGDGTMVWRRWGTGRPLVLLHGGAGSWNHWARNIGRLARDREVWAPDLPMLGESADAPAPGGLAQIEAATAEGLDHVLPGPRAFDLVGFSFGGVVATGVAEHRPGRVRRLVVVGSASLGLPRPTFALRGWLRARTPEERLAIHAHNLRQLMVASDDPDPDAVAMHAANVERARMFGSEIAAQPWVRERVGVIDVERVDAIYGALDATTRGDPEPARVVLQGQRADLRFEAIPGAGHWVQYEAPHAFEAALRRMLAD